MKSALGSGVSYPWWQRFYIWYAALTVLYWGLAGSGFAYSALSLSGRSVIGHSGTAIGNLVGLFVPIGPSNLVLFFVTPMGWIALALVLWVVFGAERKLQRTARESGIAKIFLNLCILFILTLGVDLLTRGYWASLMIVLGKV